MQNLNLTTVRDAILYLKDCQENLNPRKAKLGSKPIVWISVNNMNDFNLLTEAKKHMRNIKFIGIIKESYLGEKS